MLLQRTPCLFLEAKSLAADLGDRRWTNQAISYATQAGVGWVILSNGVDYHVYNAHAAVPLERKLFRQHSMTETPIDELVRGLALLHREEFVGNRINRAWDAHHTDAQVRTAIEALFSPAGSKALAKLIATVTTPAIPVADIVASLTRADVRITYPPPPLPAEDVVKASSRTPKPKPATASTADAPCVTPPASPRRGGLADLIAAGVLRARHPGGGPYGQRLVAVCRGVRSAASLQGRGPPMARRPPPTRWAAPPAGCRYSRRIAYGLSMVTEIAAAIGPDRRLKT